MSRNWVDGSAPFLSAANLNAMEADIVNAASVPDGALASRINDPASSANAAIKTQAAGISAALSIVFGG